MKMKEFGPPGGARVPGAPLDPPMAYQQESISVGYQPPACGPYAFHDEQVWTCRGRGRIPVQRGPS